MSEMLKPLSDPEYKSSKSLYAIDLMKFIMSFFVVGIHTVPFKSSMIGSFLLFGFFRLAVPFFFVSSSWLLFRKIDLNSISVEKIKKYISRLLIMYVLWVVIYAPIIVEDNSSLMTIIKDIVFLGYGHLWYLLASIYAVALIFILLRRRIKKGTLACIALCIFFFGLSVSGYYKLIGDDVYARTIANAYLQIFISPRNGLLFGFPYMTMGVFLAQNKKQYAKKQILFVLGGLYILHLVEMFIIRKYDLGDEYSGAFSITSPALGNHYSG